MIQRFIKYTSLHRIHIPDPQKNFNYCRIFNGWRSDHMSICNKKQWYYYHCFAKKKKIRTAFRKWVNVTYEAIKKKAIKTDHLQELHCCLNCYHTFQGWLLFFVHCIMEDSTLGPVYTRQELTPRIMLPAVGWLFWIVFINTRTNGHSLNHFKQVADRRLWEG